ncbi:MAG TPA: glycosyltransferase family 4 protein [Gammaproteobacteria bacterium]
MTNILHSIDTDGPGGAETVFAQVATGVRQYNIQSFAAIKGEDWLAAELRRRKLDPLFVDSKGSFSFRYLSQLINIVHTHKIDLILSHLFGSNVYCSLAGLICRVPVISVFHGNVDISPNDTLAKFKFRVITAGSTRIVFVSNYLRDEMTRRFNLNTGKCVTIYNGIPVQNFLPSFNDEIRNELGLKHDDLLIGAIGNIRPAKGYDQLVSAAAILAGRSDRYKFLVVGEGNNPLQAELHRRVDNLSLSGRFFFRGFCNDVARVLNNFDIFVQSSTSEGFSLSIVEAMACGLPIVATRSGGPQEILTHEKNALMVDPYSPEQIAAAIEKLAENPQLARMLSINARNHAVVSFSQETMLRAYLKLFGLESTNQESEVRMV